jgi:hypothetical protein
MSLLAVEACKEHKSDVHLAATEPGLPDDGSVPFDIVEEQGAKGETVWAAIYSSRGKTARFRIEMVSTPRRDTSDSIGFNLQMGKGKLASVPGSDASDLLVDLKKALQAKTLPVKVTRAKALPFTFAVLGENQSQAAGGGFNEKPAGNWTAIKIFIGDNDEGEVFLNLNPVQKKGEFSMKDPDYGDFVLAKFATVL